MGKEVSMKRRALLLTVLLAAATAGPGLAQTPHPSPTSAANYAKVHHATSLTNPGSAQHNVGTMSGAGCNTGAMMSRSQMAVNPINGNAQAAPIVSIPLGKGGGSVANATTKAQQTHTCAHTH
jgi:hypothetical protein